MLSFYLYSKLVYNGKVVAYRYVNKNNYYVDFTVYDVQHGKVPKSFRSSDSVKSENVILINGMLCTPIEARYFAEDRIFMSRDSKTGLMIYHIDSPYDRKVRIFINKMIDSFKAEHKNSIGNYPIKAYSRSYFYDPVEQMVEFQISDGSTNEDNDYKIEGYLETYLLRWFRMMKTRVFDVSVNRSENGVFDVSLQFDFKVGV